MFNDRDNLIEVLGRLADLSVTQAAFDAAVANHPDKRICLRQMCPRDPQQRPGQVTMARKSTSSDEQLREWRVSIIREKIQHLGRVVAPDKEAAIARAMEEFQIEPARAFRLIVVPVEERDEIGCAPYVVESVASCGRCP